MANVPFFCGKDCGGNACPLVATVESGRVARVANNPAGGKHLKGCRRGFDLALEQYAPDRIVSPLISTGERGSGQFREASWDEALDLTARKLGEVRSRYGAQAVLNRGSAAVTGAMHGTGALANRFLNLYGGCTRLVGNYSNGDAQFVLPYVLGKEWTSAGFDASTMQYSKMIVMWGANVLETRQGTDVPQRLLEAKRRGTPVVVIDPRRTPTVEYAATWWLPCRPGTDAALMLSVLHVLITEHMVDRPFVAGHSVGFDELERYVLGQDGSETRSPEWASGICGIDAAEIRRFARAYGAAKPAMLFPGYSIQRVFAGEETFRLTVALQVATGNLGVRGGSSGGLNNRLPNPRVGKLPVPLIDPQPSVPMVRWPDAILEGRRGGYPSDIHAAYSLGSGTLNQGANIRKNMAAFRALDFAVSHEVFLSPTARFCDVVFPTSTAFEKEDIGIPWAGNYLLYKPQTVSLRGQVRSDYDVLCDLADRLGFGPDFSAGRSAGQWIDSFIQQSEITDPDDFRQTGIYFGSEQERAGLADFCADPMRHPLSTPSGRVEIASSSYRQETGFPAIPTWQPAPEDMSHPLRLITPKTQHLTHSQGSNIHQLRARAAHALTVHPDDASQRGVVDGETVRVFNDVGEMHVPVRVSDGIIEGVVSLTEGQWVQLDEQGIDVGGASNMLTSTEGTRPGVACIMHGVNVEVQRR
jgi:anaerobic dimethyl sulfoxide reductase subunit A